MTNEELTAMAAVIARAEKIEGCTDHGCRLRVRRRGGMGTNGGCMCVRDGRDPDGGTTIYAPRFDVAALLHLARCAPTLLDEVRRLTAALARTEADTRTALDALHTRCDALEGAAREYLAALDAVRAAEDLLARAPYGRGEPWDRAYTVALERVQVARVALRAAVTP